ncbi:MAG: response regulator [Alphaproteobacteria bacterium]
MCACLVIAHFTELAELWNEWAEANEGLEVDEVPMALAISAFGVAWFAFRRWRDSQVRAAALIDANESLESEIQRRAEVERTLAEANREAHRIATEAKEANEAKSRFLATISHEIRTPMNGVLGMAGLLVDSELNDDQRHQAKAIISSGEALLDLINDILDLAKVESGKIVLEPIDFSLPEMVDGVVELMGPRAHKKGIEIASSMDGEVPILLHGDQGRIRQILLNLVGNAVKFTEEGGVAVSVALERSEGDQSWVRFEVSDTGIGIPDAARGSLFQKFNQVDGTTTRRFGGTGLGLAISRELVALMGGSIGFDSTEGKGSTFRFTLPLKNLNGTNRESLSDLAGDLVGRTILVVDDTDISRDVWVRSLAALGLEADTEADGPAALRALMHKSYDIVILDHMMPGMDGVAVAKAIKGLDLAKRPLLVLSSSSGLVTSQVEAEKLGFDASMPKPLRRSTMTAGLRILVERSSEVVFPRGEMTPQMLAEAVNPAASANAGKGRVLLVEDNAVNQMFVNVTLSRAGYRVDIANSGAEALNLFHQLPYDVVLMDVQMPEMDGLEATRRIRARHPDRRTPIIALTANAMKGDRDICIEAGMNDYLAKPVDKTRLLATVAAWIEESRNGGAADQPAGPERVERRAS